MNNNDLLSEIVSRYGQYNNPSFNVNPFLNLNSAGTFVSSLANGQGAGANMSQAQQDEARYYFLKAMQGAGVQGKVTPEDAQWLQFAGQPGYGFTKESVLDAAKRNILYNGTVSPQDAMILDAFNQGPTRWSNEAGTFQTEAQKYNANPMTMQMGQALGFQSENPFDGMDYNDASTRWKMDQYAQAHPGWTPMASTYKGGPPPSVGLGPGSFSNGANLYAEKPGTASSANAQWYAQNGGAVAGGVNWTTSNPNSSANAGQKPATSNSTTANGGDVYHPEGATTAGIGIPPPTGIAVSGGGGTAPNTGMTGQAATPTYTGNTYNPYKQGLAGEGTTGSGQNNAYDSNSLNNANKQKRMLNFIS